MTKYGSTAEMQKLAWGGTKASTPDILESIQNTVTTLINNILNRNADFTTVPTPINDIANCVNRFVKFAKTRPELVFLVTEIGCGLAGYKAKEIAPLFKDAVYVDNIHLPERFWQYLV